MPDNQAFRHLGEWGIALVDACAGRGVDRRLLRAPTGAGESDPTLGGFLVPEALAPEILATVYADRNSVLSYLTKLNIPDGSNTLNLPGVDETSRVDGYRWGGVVVDYEDEGVTQTNSWPRLKSTKFSPPKMIGFAPVSNELLADADNLATFLEQAFADELRYKLEKYVLSSAGTGAGKPQSILNAGALVTVAKDSAQTAGTVTYNNILNMWAALPSASRKRAIWAVSEGAMAQAEANLPYPLYPVSGASVPDDLPRIQGRPAIETDVLPACGTLGDILLIDPVWYGVASKPIVSALSAHVLFVNDQAMFRITWRVDGRPLISTQLTASDGTKRSPYIALAARS